MQAAAVAGRALSGLHSRLAETAINIGIACLGRSSIMSRSTIRRPRYWSQACATGTVRISDFPQITQLKNFSTESMLLLRLHADVMACSGADFLLVPTKVLTELALTPTSAGYNDGLRAAATADDAEGPALSPNAAEKSGVQQVSPVTEGVFNDGLDMMATDLLKQGLKQQVRRVW